MTSEGLMPPSIEAPNWWRPRVTPRAPRGYGHLIESMRHLQDVLASAAPDESVVGQVTQLLAEAADVLEPTLVDEWSRISGFAADLPDRGSFLLPRFVRSFEDGHIVRGTVRFGAYHLGGNGAAHGGTIPLLFDEVLGSLANSEGRITARTAYLHVDYRSVTPVERDLHLEARFAREEGRKRWVTGVIRDGDRVCAEAEGLFIELRPGQD